jgi:uncharacterized protein YbjT (DUF2867 family)
MRVLVTGGTGVIGESAVRALHGHGHEVRVLSRHAGRGQQWWPEGVDGWAGDISNEKSIRGSADGCDAVLHIAGIAEEQPPSRTFQSVNIEGTRYVVLEAERAGVKRVVFVSSLGADRGTSAYHKSKCVAEDVVRGFSRDWVVVRPGAVYGPGDENISVLLRMVRSLPVIPTIGDGEQKFQPIWHEDLGRALALAVERDDVRCQVLDVAGPEVTSQNDLTARLRKITNRAAVQAPLPELFASWGMRALEAIGVDVPFTESQMHMLSEGNYIPAGAPNALTSVFGIVPTRLDDGLRRLASEQPEQHPSDGVGALTRRRYWVDIRGGTFDADGLFEYVRNNLAALLPPVVTMQVEGSAATRIVEGMTLTLELPVRGQVQVRVAEVSDGRITLLTLAGHPIAGAVRLLTEARGDAVRFEIQVFDRAATVLDEVMLRTIGEWLQRSAWVGLAENVARAAGGPSADVQSDAEELDDAEMKLVDEWAKALSAAGQRSRNSTSSGRD